MTTTKKTKAPDKKKAVPVEGAAPQQPVISGFKGFDQNMKCRDFQYKVGEVFKRKPESVENHRDSPQQKHNLPPVH